MTPLERLEEEQKRYSEVVTEALTSLLPPKRTCAIGRRNAIRKIDKARHALSTAENELRKWRWGQKLNRKQERGG